MYEYKKAFTLVEVLLVVALTLAMFSMSLMILTSFSKPHFDEKDFEEIKNTLDYIKYLKMAGEKDISIICDDRKLGLYLDNKIIAENLLTSFTCEKQISFEPFLLKFSKASSTFEVIINRYGYVLFKRI